MMRKIIDFVAGRISLQPFFETLYTAGVYGMNYGNGGNFNKSGELFAAKYIRSKCAGLGTPVTIFDVGANKGNYALEIAATFSGVKFAIHCFEPSKETFAYLSNNLQNKEYLHLNNCGLGEKEETLTLYTNNPLSGLASVYHRQLDHFGIDMSKTEQISITTIDSYCQTNNVQQIDFLKMDIEGHELKCLKGAAAMIAAKKIQFIQFEFGGCNIDSRTYFQDFWYLLKDHYTFYRIVKNGLVPIRQYNERLELFKNINFLVELKK